MDTTFILIKVNWYILKSHQLAAPVFMSEVIVAINFQIYYR